MFSWVPTATSETPDRDSVHKHELSANMFTGCTCTGLIFAAACGHVE